MGEIKAWLKLEAVVGESTSLPGGIDLTACSFGVSNPTKRPAGRVSYDELRCVAEPSSASPVLRSQVGGRFHKLCLCYMELDEEEGTAPRYIKLELKEVLVTRYQVTTAPDTEGPVEEFNLRFKDLTFFDIWDSLP